MLHFLTEFFTGVQFYLFILGVFTVLFWIIPQKRQWVSFLVTTILFAYMAYMLVPDRTDDLQLYFWFIDDMRELGRSQFDYFVAQDDFGWQTYKVSAYFFYFFSLLPSPQYDHFMPAITILIVYGTALHSINVVSKHFSIDKFHTYLGTMFFLASYWFYDTAAGIRNGLAFGIAFACSVTQFLRKKHYILCFIGYFIAIFFHSGGILAVILVVVTMVTLKIDSKAVSFGLLFSVFIGSSILNYFSDKTDNGFIQSVTEKSEHYGERMGIILQTNQIVNIATFAITATLLIYLTNYIKQSDQFNELADFHKYSVNTMFFLAGTVVVSILFGRYVRWIIPPLGAIIIMLGFQFQKNEIEKKGISYAHYFAPPLARLKYKLRPVVIMVLVVFIVIYIWYDVNGSSMIWAHFEHEWKEMGQPYVWECWYEEVGSW